jgi:hypothetical protein
VGDIQFHWVDPTIDRGHHDMSHDDSVADTQEKLKRSTSGTPSSSTT